MWPKAMMELLPHLVRLVPAANRFLQDPSQADGATRNAVESLSAAVRNDLEQIKAAHAGVYRQLNEQAAKLDLMAADVSTMRTAVENGEARVARMNRRMNMQTRLLIAAVVMIFLLMLMVFALLFKR